MNNLDALIKNIVLIAVAIFVYIKIEKNKKNSPVVPAVIFAAVIAFVFILFPVKAYKVQNETKVEEYVPLTDTYSEKTTLSSPEDSILNNNEELKIKENEIKDSIKNQNENPVERPKENKKEEKVYRPKKSVFHQFTDFNGETVNLDKGEKIVALFSIDCEHCMDTAYKIGKLKNEIDLPPVYVLFLGFEDELPNFWNNAGTTFSYKIIDPQTFFPMISDFPPRVVLLNNGNIIGDWDYESFSKEKLKEAVEQF